MEDKNEAILNVLRFRHACKKFDAAKIIPEKDFDTILEAARLSPTSFGFEPWKIIVLRDTELKKKLYPVSWGARNSLNGASHFVILLARKKADMIYSSDYIAYMMRDVQQLPENVAENKRQVYQEFLQNDFDLLESDRAIFDWACKQTYIVLANMLVTAAYLGIDSCPIEGFNRQAVNQLLVEENLFDAGQFGVSVMAGFGYRAEPPRHEKTRKCLSELVLWK